jgi:heavy metal sensor kinase
LALWHGFALLAVVSVYAIAVMVQVRDDLYEGLDGQLEGDAALVFQWLRGNPRPVESGVGAFEPPALNGDSRADVPWVDAWSPDGRRLFEAGRRPGLPSRPDLPPTWLHAPLSLDLSDGSRARTLTRTATIGGRPVFVRVGRSEDFARQELREFAAVLGVSLPFAFAIAVGAGYLLARRALAPVASMTVRARRITAEHLEERLPVEHADDEFGQLASVVNDALGRLERSFHTLRRFTADASHELRTPLTAIRSVGEVGLRERRTEAEYREMVGSILEEAERLTTMTDSLLLLSRADSGKTDLRPATIVLGDLVTEVAADLEVLAEEKGQRLGVDVDPKVVVSADRPTLRQAVINLLDNAIKYSPDDAPIRLVVRRRGERGVLEVIDQGPGIEPEHLLHIFERFYRVDKARARGAGGAGLGLAIARWAVEANGGSLEVESAPGHGSVFRITLTLPLKETS